MAGTPPRHVSFLETGRARPTEGMVQRLATALALPPEEHNDLLVRAGFAPAFQARALSDAALAGVQFVVQRLLASHEPFPALVVNAWYDILSINSGAAALLGALGLPVGQLSSAASPPNLVELLLSALRPVITNDADVLRDTQRRLRRDVADRPNDDRIAALLARVTDAVDALPRASARDTTTYDSPVLLTRFRTTQGSLDTLSAMVHFGSAHDITVHGMHVELIYPADTRSADLLRALCTTVE